MSNLSLIEAAIDVPLMDIKNIAKLIEEYSLEEDLSVMVYFRDYMRELYSHCLNNFPEDGLKGALMDYRLISDDGDIFYHDINIYKDILIKTTSNRFSRN